jgi:hypothetical protein
VEYLKVLFWSLCYFRGMSTIYSSYHKEKLQLYADDAVVIYSHKEADNLFADMQHDLNLIVWWLTQKKVNM